MKRVLTYVGSQVYEWYDSAQAQNSMTALAKLCAAVFGSSGMVNGLACTPTGPASLAVNIGPGEIYQSASLEATVAGTLPADTSHTIVKQGIQLGTVTTGTMAAPVSSGQSINYLVQAQYQDSDVSIDPTTGTSPVVLQFYNASNPATPWSGPNNSGSTSNTMRDGIVAIQVLAGSPASTGSQVTPAPTTGWLGLWVVTVAFGQSTITAPNISQYTGAQVLPSPVTNGRVIGFRSLSGAGTYTATPGTNSIDILYVGGGGGGGGTQTNGASAASAGAGGGAGAWGRTRLASGFNNVSYSVGAGGAGGLSTGGAGGTGGTTSFGSLSAPGGTGGTYGATIAYASMPTIQGSGTGGAAASVVGATIGGGGGNGNYAVYFSTPTSGKGGTSIFGEGGNYVTGYANGLAGPSPGSGGSGASAGAGNSGVAGGAGAMGAIFIIEYA